MTDGIETVVPAQLANYLRRELSSLDTFGAYWYRVIGDRHAYAAELVAEVKSEPVIVLQVRDIRFDNPNALLDDLIALLERNRETCRRMIADGSTDRCAVIVLARTELNLPQVSSPVQLPDWFPVRGGFVVYTRILDVTWVATTALNCPEACVPDLCGALYRLEKALIARLADTHKRDKAATNALLDYIRSDSSEGFLDLLASARESIDSVTNPDAYRPTLKGAQGVVSRLWRCAQTQNPDSLGRVGKALATALQLPVEASWPDDTLVSILRRPTNRIEGLERRFTFNLITTVATAAQFTTAAAHADDYPALPVALVRTVSYDLRRSLSEIETIVSQLP